MGKYSKLDRVKMMGTCGKINAIWWNIKINLQKIGRYMWIWIANKSAKFHAKRLHRSENIPHSFGGGYFKKKHPEAWLDQTPCKIHCWTDFYFITPTMSLFGIYPLVCGIQFSTAIMNLLSLMTISYTAAKYTSTTYHNAAFHQALNHE